MLTKGAIGNLVNRYRAVLKKCNLMNTFGSLAVASMLVLGGAGDAAATDYTNLVYLDQNSEHFVLDKNSKIEAGNEYGMQLVGGSAEIYGTVNSNSYGVVLLNDSSLIVGDGASINQVIWTLGQYTGSSIEINGGNISTPDIAVYYAQDKTLKITGGTIHGEKETGVEIRGGTAIISGGSFTSKGSPASAESNDSGSTTVGAALAISQHLTNLPITVTIDGGSFTAARALYIGDTNDKHLTQTTVTISEGTFNGTEHALYIEDAVNPESTDIPLALSITGGTFNGKIESKDANVTGFISGGTFSDESAFDYLASKAKITVTDTEIGTYGNEAGDEHSITFGAEGGSTVNEVKLADNSTTTFDGKAAITKMTAGENTTLTINSANISAKESELGNTKVKASGEVNDALGGAEGLAAQLGTTVDKIGSLNMDEGLISGAVVNGVQQANTVMQDALEMSTTAQLAVGRTIMNDVRKRMGDLRDSKEDAGVWMRWDGGKLKGDSGLTNNFNTIQIGGDMLTGIKNVRAGVAAAFTHGDVDHNNGDGEMETYSFSAYGTWVADNGMFADVIARVGFTNTELNVKGRSVDLDNEVLSLSGEYGWRLPVCSQFYVEPQVELTYTYVTSADSKLDYATYEVDSMDSLLGRAGMAFGWNLPNDRGNVYARASVVHEFLGDSKITGSAFGNTEVYELDGDDTWFEYGIGANVKLTDNTYIWADVERTEGAEIDEEWRGTVGIRYSF